MVRGREAFDGLWGEEMRRKRKRTRCDDAAAAAARAVLADISLMNREPACVPNSGKYVIL